MNTVTVGFFDELVKLAQTPAPAPAPNMTSAPKQKRPAFAPPAARKQPGLVPIQSTPSKPPKPAQPGQQWKPPNQRQPNPSYQPRTWDTGRHGPAFASRAAMYRRRGHLSGPSQSAAGNDSYEAELRAKRKPTRTIMPAPGGGAQTTVSEPRRLRMGRPAKRKGGEFWGNTEFMNRRGDYKIDG